MNDNATEPIDDLEYTQHDLVSGAVGVRQSILARLIIHPDASWLVAVADRLSDSDSNVRYLATIALSRLGEAAAAPLCSALASHHDVAVRNVAAASVAGGNEAWQSAIGPLRAALDDADPGLRQQAAAAMARIGERAVGHLIDALESPDVQSQTWAARSLGWIGAAALPGIDRLQQLGATAAPPVQFAAAAAEAKISGDASRALSCLTEAALHSHPEIRRQAVVQLGELGPLGQPAAPRLAGRLADESEPVACEAALAIARVKADDPATIQALVETLSAPRADVRYHALIALTNLGLASRAALPAIDRLRNDQNPRVAAAAAAAADALASGGDDA